MTNPNSSPMRPNLANIPERAKLEGKFCCWKYQPRPNGAKPAKIPYNPQTGLPANVAEPNTFGSYEDVRDFAQKGYDGCGILVYPLSDGARLVVIDIDNCRDVQGSLSQMAADIIQTMRAYTEISPSGHGNRILCLVSAEFTFDIGRFYINNPSIGLEVYDWAVTKKYASVTGNTLTPGVDLEERDKELLAVLEKYMVRAERLAPQLQPQQAAPVSGQQSYELRPEDMELIENCKRGSSGEKFTALWNGDMSAYNGDHSVADLSFCNMVAARVQDPAQIDRIFRNSALMRPKWDRQTGNTTYGGMTIQKAISSALVYRQKLEKEKQASLAAPLPPMAVSAQQMIPQQPPAVSIREVLSKQPPMAPAQQVLPPTAVSLKGSTPKRKIPPLTSAKELASMVLAALVFLVNGILPEGVTILASAPKLGKSFMMMQLALALTTGTPFLGRQTTQVGVVYFALEDGRRRLQERMNDLLDGRPVPEHLYFVTETYRIDDGLFEVIDAYKDQDPSIKVAIIDTLQCIRGRGALQGKYQFDSQEISSLKKYADDRGISVLIVHHTRKASDAGDPHSNISGTQGIFGSVDTAWVLEKHKRSENKAVLHITGRDVFQQDLVLSFDKATSQWQYHGGASELARQDYEADMTVTTIRELLDESPDGCWHGKVSDLMAIGRSKGRILANSLQTLGKELSRLEADMLTYDNIQHTTTHANGNGGYVHHFYDMASILMAEQGCEPDNLG